MDHESARAFFAAIGYDEAMKRRCKRQLKKFDADSTLPNGWYAVLDSTPYRVALPGVKTT